MNRFPGHDTPVVFFLGNCGDTALVPVLRQQGFEVVHIDSACGIFTEPVGPTPHALIVDLDLRDPVSGCDLAMWVRRHPVWRHATLIAVSTHAFTPNKSAAAAAGFDFFFVKPAHPDLVADAVATTEQGGLGAMVDVSVVLTDAARAMRPTKAGGTVR